MNDATANVLAELQARGYRITDARKSVCQALANAGAPITVQELVARTDHDEASVYRCIRMLHEEALVEEIVTRSDRPRYELHTHHHHHAVCTDCGFVAHVACTKKPAAPASVAGFDSIEDHDVTFYGRCSRCA